MGTSIDAWWAAEAMPAGGAGLVAQFDSVRPWLAVAALAIVIGLLLMRAARRQRASRADGFGWPAAARRDGLRQPGAGHPPTLSPGAPHEAARWEVEMHEIARALSGQLDSKMRALGALVAEADRAAARLERALAETRPPGVASAEPPPSAGQSGEPPASETPSTFDGLRDEVEMLSMYGYPPAEIARRLDIPVREVERLLADRAS